MMLDIQHGYLDIHERTWSLGSRKRSFESLKYDGKAAGCRLFLVHLLTSE